MFDIQLQQPCLHPLEASLPYCKGKNNNFSEVLD